MATSQKTSERRAAHRVSSDIEVRYGTSGELILAEACDLSQHGIGLLGPKLFPIGSEVELRFRAPREGTGTSTLLFLRGTVRHSTGSRMGLQFIDVPETARQELRESVRQLHAP